MTGLEEQLVSKSELEQEKDSETLKSRKLVKLAEKYKRELEEANLEIRDLKAQLHESTDFRVSVESSQTQQFFTDNTVQTF